MDGNLRHEDLLIKLRAKLNEDKIKLWEPPYVQADDTEPQVLQDLAKRYSTELSVEYEEVLLALHELQSHSLDRSKANAEFKETGFATFRVKATVPGDRPKNLKIQKKLDVMGSELIAAVAVEVGVVDSRVKLIFNGKVIKVSPSLEEQGVKNGAQIMALVMAETPEETRREDTMYMEMCATRDDAALLAECEDGVDGDEYIKLEDQSGATVALPQAERRALMVGLALHARGRRAASPPQPDHALALVLYLEADRHFSECRSSLLQSVDNWALLQLDIAWCYLCLQSLAAAGDAAARLARAEQAFRDSYGEDHQRLVAIKGTAANERVLLMRLYLLQGIVAFHQNRRADARRLLEAAEREINSLRVDESSVLALVELGWSRAAARAGLRAAAGDLDRAHHYLADRKEKRDKARERHKLERQQRQLGLCDDGSTISEPLVLALGDMGYSRRLAVAALRKSNNVAAEAVRLIQETPQLLDMDSDSDSLSSDESIDVNLAHVSELVSMGYAEEASVAALRRARGDRANAVELLVAGGGKVPERRRRKKRSKRDKSKAKNQTQTKDSTTKDTKAPKAPTGSTTAPSNSKASQDGSGQPEDLTKEPKVASTSTVAVGRREGQSSATVAGVATVAPAATVAQAAMATPVAQAAPAASTAPARQAAPTTPAAVESTNGNGNPSTSTGVASKKTRRHKKGKSKRNEREQALARLQERLRGADDDHLDSDLQQEEQYLAQYFSLL